LEDLIGPYTTLRQLSARQIAINAIDILLVAYLIYRILMLVRGTRAFRIIVGVIFFVVVLVLSDRLGFNTLHWILDKATYLGPAALVILLLPELRTAIEGFGAIPQKLVLTTTSGPSSDIAQAKTIEELVAACTELAAESVGALIVIERTAHLDEIISNGVALDASISAPLLGSIFYEGNPLHDGAVIIRGDLIASAACRLPLSESSRLDQSVHMRHRAAVGVTEAFDCLTIVVSEERGTISIAEGGRLRRLANAHELREVLNRELRTAKPSPEKRRGKEPEAATVD
jgi:diadenylate cyclase